MPCVSPADDAEGHDLFIFSENIFFSSDSKKLYFSKKFIAQRQESYENIMSEKGILYRMNRSIQVGGTFGVPKNDYEFQRFLMRGKSKVKIEILFGVGNWQDNLKN